MPGPCPCSNTFIYTHPAAGSSGQNLTAKAQRREDRKETRQIGSLNFFAKLCALCAFAVKKLSL
jgi:hypothetical protein